MKSKLLILILIKTLCASAQNKTISAVNRDTMPDCIDQYCDVAFAPYRDSIFFCVTVEWEKQRTRLVSFNHKTKKHDTSYIKRAYYTLCPPRKTINNKQN